MTKIGFLLANLEAWSVTVVFVVTSLRVAAVVIGGVVPLKISQKKHRVS